MQNTLIYDVHDKVPFWQNLLFALQQVMAIIVATILLPVVVDPAGVYLNQASTLIGAAVGTIFYLIITQFKSPVFLGSSFSYVAPLSIALSYGYFGIVMGTVFAGLTYVLLAIIVKFAGTNWINKLMPPIVIGPTVALIGFSLSMSAMENVMNTSSGEANYSLISIFLGILTFLIVVIISTKDNRKIRFFPFIVAIVIGYINCIVLHFIGIWTGIVEFQIMDFAPFSKIADFSNWLPNFTFIGLFEEGIAPISNFGNIITIFIAYVPIALASFAEHVADHKNLGSIINHDLIQNPGLKRTLLGDGVGSMVGAIFGGCPNTTYGESIGCVALSQNASTRTIFLACIISIIIAFFYPLIVFFETIPQCVVGGICIALYGFISVSGLRMFKNIDLNDSRNLFVIASILICGIGGLHLSFGSIEITSIATALIVGIITNVILTRNKQTSFISKNRELLESQETIDDNESTENVDNNESKNE